MELKINFNAALAIFSQNYLSTVFKDKSFSPFKPRKFLLSHSRDLQGNLCLTLHISRDEEETQGGGGVLV